MTNKKKGTFLSGERKIEPPAHNIYVYRFELHIKIQIQYSGGNDLDLEILGAHSRIG